MHRREAFANPTEVTKSLLRLVASGELAVLLTAEPRVQTVGRQQQYRLSPSDLEQLVVRYNETKNMRQVAREFGISRTTVRSRLGLLGIKVRASKPISELQKQKARDLYDAGWSLNRIGRALGRDPKTVKKAM